MKQRAPRTTTPDSPPRRSGPRRDRSAQGKLGNQALQERVRAQGPGAGDAEGGEEDWGIPEKERTFFERALQIEEKDLQDLTTGWYQTTEGNCVTVAIAKAAADALGTEVFKSMEKTTSGLKIALRDGHEIELTADELVAARGASDFGGENKDSLAYGTVIYAAAAKRAQEEKHEGARSYRSALNALNNGEYPTDVMGFLGLSDRMKQVDVNNLNKQDSVVASSNSHAIFVDRKKDGHVADHYGDAVTYNGTDTNRSTSGRRRRRRRSNSNGIISAFSIRGLSEEEQKKQ